jgi:hypothetical protein
MFYNSEQTGVFEGLFNNSGPDFSRQYFLSNYGVGGYGLAREASQASLELEPSALLRVSKRLRIRGGFSTMISIPIGILRGGGVSRTRRFFP